MDLRSIRRGIAACMFPSAALFFAPVHAATLASWDFDAADGTFTSEVDTLAAGASVGAWSDLDGTLTSFNGSSGRAIGARSFDDGNSLLISVDAGGTFGLEELRFEQQASASGPKTWTVRLNGNVVASGTTASTLTAVVVPLALTARLFELSFDGLGASSGQGTWRLDNVSLAGTSPVPVPGALPLFAAALLGLRRRRG